MSKRALIFAGSVILAVAMLHVWQRQPSRRPSASIGLEGYASDGESIVAKIVLTNTGSSALAYVAGFGGTLYSVSAMTQEGTTNYGSWVRTTVDNVVWPSEIVRIRVQLPPATKMWHCAVPIRRAGSRIKMFTRLAESGVWNRAETLSSGFIRLFPLDHADYTEIQSDTFEISTNTLR